METISMFDLALVSGGQAAPAPADTNPPPKDPGVNPETYRHVGGEIGKIGGELLGSETAAKHLEKAGQILGEGLYNAGDWLGRQAGRLIYGS